MNGQWFLTAFALAGLFAAAGNAASSLAGERTLVHTLQENRTDVGVLTILSPTGSVDSGTAVTPACSVYNYGDSAVSYGVRMTIGTAYDRTSALLNHQPGTAAYVTFPSWTALPRGAVAVSCSTRLSADENPGNDKQTGEVVVRVRDVGSVRLLAPSGTLDSGDMRYPVARVRNFGNTSDSFAVAFRIGAFYGDTQAVTNLAPGDTFDVTFQPWTALQRGTHVIKCSTRLYGDLRTSNDAISGSVTVRVRDVAAVRFVTPAGPVDSGAPIVPQVMVRNPGTHASTFPVRLRIGSFYNNQQNVTSLGPADSAIVNFASWVPVTRGTYAMKCTTALSLDRVVSNDTVSGAVTVRVRDVGVARLLAPGGIIDSGTAVTPACTVGNYGSTVESYTVRMCVVGCYDSTATVTEHAPGDRVLVTFPRWTAERHGVFEVKCTTRLSGDLVKSNDRQTGTVAVRLVDAQAVAILAPTGVVDSGAVVAPQALVRNNGTTAASFDVRLSIGSGYVNTQTVTALGVGAAVVVDFAGWTAGRRGEYPVSCTTQLSGDMNPANDRISLLVGVAVHDVGVVAITCPGANVKPGLLAPTAVVRNFGTVRGLARVVFAIHAGQPYRDSLTLPGGVPFHDTTLRFADWIAPVGRFVALCSAWQEGDQVPSNNSKSQAFTSGRPGWTELRPVPAAPSLRQVKDGGWLVADGQQVFVAKGNKQPDFYMYDVLRDSWNERALWPSGREGKNPHKGSTACGDGNGRIFAVKGNNQRGFWVYHAPTDSWEQRQDVPLGPSNKKVKGGTDIVWVSRDGDGYAYLLKGHKNEFYRYDATTDSWHALPSAPVGSSPKWDKGSWLACDGTRYIYAHKAKCHEFYSYNTLNDSWDPTPLKGMPMQGSGGSKKSKDGGGAAWSDGVVYALKGGNTQELWGYDVTAAAWRELDTLPSVGATTKRKKVKAGGDIASLGNNVFFALKGNKTNEFWRYIVPATATGLQPDPRPGVLAMGTVSASRHLSISPNPVVTGMTTVSWSGLSGYAGIDRFRLCLFDVAGRLVRESEVPEHQAEVRLDTRTLPPGVYLLRLSSSHRTLSHKLVVQR